MLSLPSVSSTPSVVSRPLLVADTAVRATGVARAIEPTTAVSKERSKVEVRVPDGMARATSPAASAEQAAPVVVRAPVAADSPQPPVARSAVQKAMDTQIKELFSSVWKASAKAVDFLLGRDEPTAAQVAAAAEPMSAILWSLTAPAGSRFSHAALASASQAPSVAPDFEPIVYSSRGSSAAQSSVSRGGLLDVLA